MTGGIEWRLSVALMPRVAYDVMDDQGLSAEDVMHLPAGELALLCGMDDADEAARMRDTAHDAARAELSFLERNRVKILFPGDDDFPYRASERVRMLAVCGEASLNATRTLAVVGTRKATPYGTAVVDRLIGGLADESAPVTIVSGLAFGIDAAAHRAALSHGMPTVAVVGHGLGMMYPAAHRGLAEKIVKAGGAIVTEYLHDVKPYRNHFLQRNAVIAALSDATLIVESDVKGGALNTAAHARELGRVVLACPGRITDVTSAGCNALLRTGRAVAVTSARDIVESVGWKVESAPAVRQRSLFPELTPEQQHIMTALDGRADPLHIDEITRLCGMPVYAVMSLIAEMEVDGMVIRWPGNRYSSATR